MVRVANNDATQIKRVLDLGFLSLIVPNISDKNAALLAAKSSLYPPHGFRGISANSRANLFGSDQNYLKNFNNELLLITQIESKIGYHNIDEICEVDPVDVLFIGPQDLAADLGHLGNPSHPDVKKVMNDIVKKTLSNKKIPGILALNLDDAKYWIDQGVLLISVASDQFLLSEQTKKILEFLKNKNMADTKKIDINNIDNIIGTSFLSDWFTISQDQINLFAESTKDLQWIHIDKEKSLKESPFKDTVAHGFLTLSMLVHLIEQTIEITGAKMGVNYGFEKIRFVSPVLSNSKIRLNVKINKVEDIENGIKIFWDVIVENSSSDKPAIVAQWITLKYR